MKAQTSTTLITIYNLGNGKAIKNLQLTNFCIRYLKFVVANYVILSQC